MRNRAVNPLLRGFQLPPASRHALRVTVASYQQEKIYFGSMNQSFFKSQMQLISTQPSEPKSFENEITGPLSSISPGIVDNLNAWVNVDGSAVRLLDQNGVETTLFHAVWLWDNDPSHIHPTSGQRRRSCMSFYEHSWRIQSAIILEYDGPCNKKSPDKQGIVVPVPPPKGCFHPTGAVYETDDRITKKREASKLLRVDWLGLGSTTRSSYYDLSWLLRCRYDDNARLQRQAQTVSTEQVLGSGKHLFETSFGCILSNNDDSMFSLLSAIVENGAALVRDTPERHGDSESVALLGQRLAGSLSHGHLYGNTFHVQATHQANNIAFTSEALVPHQDLAYYESPPGLQLLHCVKNSVNGGESKLIDALAAANEFRRLCPDLFDALVNTEATFLKQRVGADLVYRRSNIRVDSNGQVVSVHWAPPFRGPLLLLSADAVEHYFVAQAAFERMIDNSLPSRRLLPRMDPAVEEALRDYAMCYTWERRLKPGETLVFNNQRMLHGRNAFETSIDGCDRQLVGCYTNIDETMNQYRLLRRKRVAGETSAFVRSVGNGSSDVM
jgi:hypothetical protein